MRNHDVKKTLMLTGVMSAALAAVLFFGAGCSESLYVLYIPFDYLAQLLRQLSLHSVEGNAAAVVIYVLFCSLPLLLCIRKSRKKGLEPADWLLAAAGLFSFYMMYQLINPTLLLEHFSSASAAFGGMGEAVFLEGGLPAGEMAKMGLLSEAQAVPRPELGAETLPVLKYTLVSIFYSILIAYLMLREISRLGRKSELDQPETCCGDAENTVETICTKADSGNNAHGMILCMERIVYAATVIYTILIGYFESFLLFGKIDKYTRSAFGDLAFALLDYALEVAPMLLTLGVFYTAILLLQALRERPYGEAAEGMAARLSAASKRTVIVSVWCNLAGNAMQWLFASRLHDTSFQLEISLLPLIIAFASMLLADGFRKTRLLQEDSEMII